MGRMLRRLLPAALVILLLGTSACSSGAADSEASVGGWCAEVGKLPELRELLSNTNKKTPSDGLTMLWKAYDDMKARLKSTAPAFIKEDVANVFGTHSETAPISEKKQWEAAQARVNAFIRDKCDLDVQL